MCRLPVLLSFLAIAVVLSHVSAQSDDNSTAPNECDALVPGYIYFTYLRSAEPDELVLLPFADIPGDMTLYLTDNAWTGSNFQSDEGTLELTTPPEGIPQGTNFGYGPSANLGQDWVAVEGAFSLDPLGDHVFLYCLGSMDVVPLAAISYNGPFQPADLPTYGKNESALPDDLATNGTIVLGQCGTWEYAGTQSAEINVLKSSITNVDNWKGKSCTDGSGGLSMRISWTERLQALATGFMMVYVIG